MKIKKRSKIKKPVIVAVVAAVLVAVAAFSVYALVLKPQDDKASDTAQTQDFTSDKLQSEKLEDNPENKNIKPNTDIPPSPSPASGSSKKQVQVIASTDQSGGTVFIRGGVNYPVVGGSCYALLSGPSGQSVRKNSTVLSNPASADCKTIAIPASELASGKWTFTLNYTSDTYEGASNEVSFTL